MVSHNTVGVGRTGARIHTLLIAAGEHLRTVVVHRALGPSTGHPRVTQVAGRTHAAGTVIGRLTDGLGAALLVDAGILAGAGYAGLRQRTLQVAVAARCKNDV
jgi:hypothetical protein